MPGFPFRSQATRTSVAIWVWLLALMACSPRSSPAPTTPTPALVPLGNTPPATRTPGPAPTVANTEGNIPGRILFAKQGDIWIWQDDTGRQLTTSGDLWQPSWSPDGTLITCIRRGQSYSDVMLLAADGSSPVTVTQNSSNEPLNSFERIYSSIWAFYPVFSPDGRDVTYSSQAGPPGQSPAVEYRLTLFTAPAGGNSAPQQLFASAEGQVGRMAYAPDGELIFEFAPTSVDQQPVLQRLDPQSEQATPLANVPPTSYNPAISADGTWLAYATRTDNRTDLFALPLAGGTPTQLTTVGSARAPAFSPDGKQLAFLAVAPGGNGFDLWVANLAIEGGTIRADTPRQITTNMQIDADSGLSWGR